MSVRLRTLGGLRVHRDGRELTSLPGQPLRCSFLVFLALERDTTRDAVVALLWPEKDEERARHSLSQLLYELRRQCGDGWLSTAGDRLRATDRLRVDAREFEERVERRAWSDALDLYGGAFLEDTHLAATRPFEAWVDRRRSRLSRRHRKARSRFVEEKIEAGALDEALTAARRWVELEPLDDGAHHRLIELLALRGERSAALEHFERYRRLVEEELELEPLDRTLSLVDRIRSGELPARAGPSSLPEPPGAAPGEEAPTEPATRRGPIRRLVDELRVRSVFQVAAVYVAAAWVALQAVDMLIERGLLPEWSFVTGLGLAAVGLAAVVALAWLQEVESLGGLPGAAHAPHWVRDLRTRHLILGLGAAAVLLLGAFVVLRMTVPEAPTAAGPPSSDLRRLAVLYFDDHSVEQDLGPIAAGFTDQLIHELAQVPALDVPSRNAVKPYRDGEVTLDTLLARLGVGAFVEGAVTRAGDSLTVTVQLVEAPTQRHLESRTLSASTEDVLLLRDEIAEETARILRRRIGGEVRLRERRADASDDTAWVLVQRAEERRRAAAAHRGSDIGAARRALQAADSLLAVARSRDPEWPDPAVLDGRVAVDRALLESGVPGDVDPAWGRTALERAERAVERFGGWPDALALRGEVRFRLAEVLAGEEADSLYAGAQRDLEAAVSDAPTLARAWVVLSRLHQRKTQYAEALHAAERALEADYYLSEAAEVTWVLFQAALGGEEPDDAGRWCREGRRRWPGNPRFLLCRLFFLASFGPTDSDALERGWAAVDTMGTVTTEPEQDLVRRFGTMLMAQIAARAGLADSAESLIGRARGRPAWDTLLAYNEAHARMHMGQPGRAVELLKLHAERYPSRGAEYLAKDWWFRELRDFPAFRSYLAEEDVTPPPG